MNRAYGVIIAAAFFLAGHFVTAAYYRNEMQQQELDAAIARAEQGKRSYEKLVEAQNGLDAWRASAESMSAELERVRSAKRTVRTSADTCGVERAAVARCESLLAESVELLAEGAELSERNAAVHDALATTVK